MRTNARIAGVVMVTAGLGAGLAVAAAAAPGVAAGKKIAAAQAKVVMSMEEDSAAGVDETGGYFLFAGMLREGWRDTRYAFQGQYGDDKNKVEKLSVVASTDGKAAWMTFQVKARVYMDSDAYGFVETLRVTELIGDTGSGWRVIAAFGDTGTTDKEAHETGERFTMQGKSEVEPVVTGKTDDVAPALAPVVEALRGGTLASMVAIRKDFVNFGSAPKERGTGGKGFAKALAGWGASMSVAGPVKAGLAPSGTTGFVVAPIVVAKEKKQKDGTVTKYAIPFHLFLVVDQDASGAWKVVAAHLSVV